MTFAGSRRVEAVPEQDRRNSVFQKQSAGCEIVQRQTIHFKKDNMP
jgi:hypothetical protein